MKKLSDDWEECEYKDITLETQVHFFEVIRNLISLKHDKYFLYSKTITFEIISFYQWSYLLILTLGKDLLKESFQSFERGIFKLSIIMPFRVFTLKKYKIINHL